MDNLTLAFGLISSALKEKAELDSYTADLKAITVGSYNEWCEFRSKHPHPPTKTSINNKIKVARGLLAAAYIK